MPKSYKAIKREAKRLNAEKRTGQLHFMVSEKEEKMILDRMEAAGIGNMSAYLRKMAIDGYIIRMDMSDVRDLVSLLRRCSNNLNQYARRANETGCVYAADIKDVRTRLDEIWEAAGMILSGFSKIP
jgi:hypothetical protein